MRQTRRSPPRSDLLPDAVELELHKMLYNMLRRLVLCCNMLVLELLVMPPRVPQRFRTAAFMPLVAASPKRRTISSRMSFWRNMMEVLLLPAW